MGGSSETVTPSVPPPTPEETALTSKQVELAQAQLDAIRSQTAFQQQEFNTTSPLLQQQSDVLKSFLGEINSPEVVAQRDKANQLTDLQLQSAVKNQPIQDEILQTQLDAIRRGNAATPEQVDLIGKATDAALASGNSDIDKASSDALKQITQQIAPSLGLRPTDTPILDRANLVGAEAVRQKGQLSSNLRGAEATAQLDYPLAAQQVENATATGQQSILGATQQFQNQLAQAANANRLALFGTAQNSIGTTGNLGLGLATGIPGAGAAGSALSALTQARLAGVSKTTDKSNSIFSTLLGTGGAGGAAGGIGGLLSGITAIGSSRSIKNRVREADLVLDKIARMDIDRWRYKGEDEDHVGPYAEDFQGAFDLGDGKTINLLDAVGVLFAAVKELADRHA